MRSLCLLVQLVQAGRWKVELVEELFEQLVLAGPKREKSGLS